LATKTKLIVNLTRGQCLCVGELADRPLSRMRGLLGRRGLPAGEGMLLRPAPSIHTAFMRFSIDAVFLDRNLRVLEIVEKLRPWRVASKRRARAVLELSAGECARRGVEVGDMLELRDRSGQRAGSSGAGHNGDSSPSGGVITRTRGLREGALVQWGEPARLRPLRVLVVSPDRHFRTVVSLLLERRNCSVASTANMSHLTELIARESADVVVIDRSESSTAATVAMVEQSAKRVGVVLVADEVRLGWQDQPTLAKWGPFADLLAAIERADKRRTSGANGDRG
jgi:uncharacterized protein